MLKKKKKHQPKIPHVAKIFLEKRRKNKDILEPALQGILRAFFRLDKNSDPRKKYQLLLWY